MCNFWLHVLVGFQLSQLQCLIFDKSQSSLAHNDGLAMIASCLDLSTLTSTLSKSSSMCFLTPLQHSSPCMVHEYITHCQRYQVYCLLQTKIVVHRRGGWPLLWREQHMESVSKTSRLARICNLSLGVPALRKCVLLVADGDL